MKHEKLDTVIVGIINASDWPLYTENVLDRLTKAKRDGFYTFELPNRALLLRRLNKLAGERRIYKSGSRDMIKWSTTNPRSLDRIRRIEMQRESNHKRATAAFVALGFGTDPASVKVPPEPSEDDSVCESCGGSGQTSCVTRCEPACVRPSHCSGCHDCNGYGSSPAQRAYERARAKHEACEDKLARDCGEHFVHLTTEQFLGLVKGRI